MTTDNPPTHTQLAPLKPNSVNAVSLKIAFEITKGFREFYFGRSTLTFIKPNRIYTVRLQCTRLSVCLCTGVLELTSLATRLAAP